MNAWRKEKAWREQVKYDEATPETRAFLDQNAKRMFVKEYKIAARFSHFYTAARGRSAIYRRTLGGRSICTAMLGSGARIGMRNTIRRRL